MKKSNIIVIIILIAIILIGIAVGVNSKNNSNTTVVAETTNVSQKNNSEEVTQEEKYKVPEDAKVFFDDYTNLQNEASRKVETGELKQERYFDLLEKGIQIAQMKEAYNKDGLSDELSKQIEEIKPYLYDIANEMNSELAEKFATK